MTAATVGSKLFRERLQPELDAADKDKRADRAFDYCLEAIQAGNAARAQKALDLMVQRWDEREALTEAPTWLWRHRFDHIEAIVTAAELDDPLLDTAWWQFYAILVRIDGGSAQQAAVYALAKTAGITAKEG